MGRFRCSRRSSLVRGLLPIPGSFHFVRNNGSDLLSRRDISIKLLSYNIFVILSKSNLFFVSCKLFFFCLRSFLRLPNLILLLYLLVSIDLDCTGLLRVDLLEEATKL